MLSGPSPSSTVSIFLAGAPRRYRGLMLGRILSCICFTAHYEGPQGTLICGAGWF